MEGDGSIARYHRGFASLLAPRSDQYWDPPEQVRAVDDEDGVEGATCRVLLDMSDELLLMILNLLDPFSLLCAGGVCTALYRVSSTDSLWAKHCQVAFGSGFRTGCGDCAPKESFKLLYIWRKLYRTLPYNRQLQDLFFSGVPLKRYWVQLLTLEEMVPLPPIELPDHDIVDIWGIKKDLLDEKHKVTDEYFEDAQVSIFKYEWKELNNLALSYHGDYSKIQSHVLWKINAECHDDLEWLYCQYSRKRYQWLFSYWLFGLSKSCARQLRRIYLWWQRFDKKKVSQWGSMDCDVQYLASLHNVTNDFWNGKLADRDENIGIQTVENYFSMCRSLLAWILGRKWGRFKQKKMFKDTLEGVYRSLKSEMKVSLISHEHFWTTAKVQMYRICSLEEIAGNYVNWKLIDALPCYRLFMATGEPLYLEQIKGFLFRKQLVNNWILHKENLWVSSLLPESLFQLLEYDTKIYEERLHGDTLGAHLSRLVWLYLHSGQQIYMDAMKGFVYECAYASYTYQIYENASIPYVGF
ncbi:PREDICTED: uncharacterized protein LOC108792666 [Nanorana parkeri]|uniref:uncharacterized protein LOC108792666 n=1 Tax=Nanorana parkeri TaxID=125878 RepID=UPI00085482E9|nr:PREDICTED: uncharacterized protein LOC108792666 [Nanorana parkeri]